MINGSKMIDGVKNRTFDIMKSSLLGEAKTAVVEKEYNDIISLMRKEISQLDPVELRNDAIINVEYELINYTLRIIGIMFDDSIR